MHNSEASNITHVFIHLRLDGDADGGGGGGGSVAGLADCSRVQGAVAELHWGQGGPWPPWPMKIPTT